MTADQKRHLLKIYNLLYDARGAGGSMIVEEQSDTDKLIEAVTLILGDPLFQQALKASGSKVDIKDNHDLYAISKSYLQMWFMLKDFPAAATLIWGGDVFTCEPRSVKMIWGSIRNYRLINCLGSASAGKSYSASALWLLDWASDPDGTMVRVMSTKEDHLKRNLFAGIQRLYANSVIPLPGKADSESIATEFGKRASMGIFIMTIAQGPKAPPAIKGAKVQARARAHPIYGMQTRMRFLIDEGQEVPQKVFGEIPNLFSSFEKGDVEHIKIFVAGNPMHENSEWGKNCRNTALWDKIQTRESEIDEWESDKGWHCVRLNALKSENLLHDKTIYRGFLTRDGYEAKLKQYSGDIDAPGMWSEVYAMFPPKGSLSAIIQKHHIARSYGEWLFEGPTVGFAGMDVALTGDLPAITSGRAGKAIAWIDYNGDRHELDHPTWKLQIDTVGIMSHGDTQEVADGVMERMKILGIRPANLAIDQTGNGQGVHDVIQRQWRSKVDGIDTRSVGAQAPVGIIGVKYNECATDIKICEEDTKTPYEMYQGICSELWYAAAKFFEYDVIRIGRGVDPTTIDELQGRLGGPPSDRSKLYSVESKSEYKKKGHPSPDRADSFTLAIHAARVSIPEIRPKAPNTEIEREPEKNVIEEMKGENMPGLRVEGAVDFGEGENYGWGKEVDFNKD